MNLIMGVINKRVDGELTGHGHSPGMYIMLVSVCLLWACNGYIIFKHAASFYVLW